MSRMHVCWAAALGIALGFQAGIASAQEGWPTTTPAVSLGRPEPMAELGRPVPMPTLAAPAVVTPVGYDDLRSALPPPRVVRGQPPDPPPPTLTGPPPAPGAPPGFVGDGGYNAGVAIDRPLNHTFLDQCKEFFSGGHSKSTCGALFLSDHCFDEGIISPVTNPFFFEDPRSLTEVRPIFIYQKAPGSNPSFHGGNSEFIGLQGRLALNENWSIVWNKLGLVSLNPKDPIGAVGKGTGLAEIDIGPKWTFLRNESTQTVAAAGLTFQLPVGSKKEFQDTGTLGLDPYVTFGQSFGRSQFGSFNFLGEAGYNFAVDDKRSEFLHGSLHLDYDVARMHKFYPLVEMNWFHYTKSGRNTDLGFEGVDLVNFGSSSLGSRDFLTLAGGMRYKFNENVQLGGAVEFPLTKQKEIQDFRVTLDMIFRY